MANQTSTKVRLVRCPKCLQVLAELPDVSLYQCGGCDTVLEGKNRKQDTIGTELSSQETDGALEEKDAGSANDGSTRPPSVESSPDKDSSSFRDNSDKEVGEGTPVQVQESLKQGDPVSQNSEGYGNKPRRWSTSGSDEIPSSGQDEDDDFVDEIQNLPELEDEATDMNEPSQRCDPGVVAHENDDERQSAEQIPEIDDEVDGGLRAIGMENTTNEITHCPVSVSQRSLNESLASFYLTCPDDNPLDHSPREGNHNYGRISSIDTVGSSSLADFSSKLNFKYGSLAKYPQASSYYADDGSESSYDGTGNQIRGHRAVKGSHRAPDKQTDVSRIRPVSRDHVSSDMGSYSDAEKMDLLRRVHELKDQLNQMQFPKVGRTFSPDRKLGPYHYDHLLAEREMYHRGAYHHLARPAFSGEAAHYRHRLGCSCVHCHPHYSAQLPCKNSCCSVRTDRSFLSSPHHYTSSEMSLWGRETTKLGNPSRLKEKHRMAKKQHLLPVARGAPFIVCYRCFELLQLPVDFLIFKRRLHQLRCNACQKILKFSLKKGCRLVPYFPLDASAPPPSMADDSHDAAGLINVEPVSHSSSFQRVEALSYSASFGCSTEGESSVLSSSVKQAVPDRKMKSILMEDPSMSRMKGFELAGSSKQKQTSEIEEVHPLSNSPPLHRLMGYSSPSHVISSLN